MLIVSLVTYSYAHVYAMVYFMDTYPNPKTQHYQAKAPIEIQTTLRCATAKLHFNDIYVYTMCSYLCSVCM